MEPIDQLPYGEFIAQLVLHLKIIINAITSTKTREKVIKSPYVHMGLDSLQQICFHFPVISRAMFAVSAVTYSEVNVSPVRGSVLNL